MYTVIHTYDLLPGTKERFIQDVQERLVPFLDHVPGFHTFSLVESGDHTMTGICTYHSFADAKAAARLAGDCLSQISASCIQGDAKRAAGEVRVHSESTRLPLTSQKKLLHGSFSASRSRETRNEAPMLSSEERALYQASFAEKEIALLRQVRSTYLAERDKLERQAEYRRWQFVRYLVATGRLTEQDV